MKSLLFSFGCLLWLSVQAQTPVPPLERLVTINFHNQSVTTILNTIATQANVKFSYNPTAIPVQQKTSITCIRKPIRLVLGQLFKDAIVIKQKGEFIILIRKPVMRAHNAKYVTISGYIYNSGGDKLPTASIVNEDNRLAAVTNQYGYFSMDVPKEHFPVDIKIAKENYPDTTIHLTNENSLVDISIRGDSSGHDTFMLNKSLRKTGNFFERLFVNAATQSTMRNVKDTLFTHVQFSFVPYLSTNKLLVGNTVNDVSINVLAGYSKGIRIAEVGGLLNIDRGDVKSFQVAGLCNMVSGNTSGAQIAGIANLNEGIGNGVRIAGIVNTGRQMNGIQIGGLFNINTRMYDIFQQPHTLQDTVSGIHIAGLANMTKAYTYGIRIGGLYNNGFHMKGIQVAGLFNSNLGSFHGIQVAGLFNNTIDTSSGIQIAGLVNRNAGNGKSISIAGITNIHSGEMDGIQVTSLVNYCRTLKGMQFGLLNFSDTCEGTPVGLINFAKDGYHKIEFFSDEVLYTQLAFRTGVLHFHNIFIAGVDMTRRINGLWTLGYGIGSYHNLNKKWLFGGDLTMQWLIEPASTGTLIKLFVPLERIITPKFSIAFGPDIKFIHVESSLYNILVPYNGISNRDGVYLNNTWVGGKISFRFF